MSIPDPVTTGVALAGALQIAKQGQEFIAAATGHPGESIGTILGNTVQRRIHNLETVGNKAHLILLNIGETPKEVPLNVIHPLLEAASLPGDTNLQNIWANLLANAADPRRENPVSPTFAGILKELTARDVKFLDAVYNEALKMRGPYQLNEVRLSIDHLLTNYAAAGLSRRKNLTMVTVQEAKNDDTNLTADLEEFDFTLEVTLRNRVLSKASVPEPLDAGLVERVIAGRRAMGVVTPIHLAVSVYYTFTSLGESFVEACRPPTSTREK